MSDQETQKRYAFAFTAVPQLFIDDWLPRLSLPSRSVMLVLFRVTLGVKGRLEAYISLNDLRRRTGITSFETMEECLQELKAAGLIANLTKRGLRRTTGYYLPWLRLTTTGDVEVNPDYTFPATSTPDVDVPLRQTVKYIYRKRRSSSTADVDKKLRQPKQDKARRDPKENVLEKQLNKIDKEKVPPSATLQAGAPNVAPLVVDEKEDQEEQTIGREDQPTTPSSPPGHTMAADTQATVEKAMPRAAPLPETEKQYKREKALLDHRIQEAADGAKRAHHLGTKYAGFSESSWQLAERQAREALAKLEAEYRPEEG